MNSVNQLIDQARINKWCTRAFCTTCGAQEFTTSIIEVSSTNPCFTQDLKECDFNSLTQLNDWTGSMVRVIRYAPNIYFNEVFLYWLERKDINARIYDNLFFYIVRHYGNKDLVDLWIAKLIEISSEHEDESIVESILIHVKPKVKLYPDLTRLIQNRYTSNYKIMRLANFR